MGWISVNDRLPEIGQIVDIWFIDTKHNRDINNMLKGTNWYNNNIPRRITNLKYLVKIDGEGEYSIFDNMLYSYEHKEYCIEDDEITHWTPLPEPPSKVQ